MPVKSLGRLFRQYILNRFIRGFSVLAVNQRMDEISTLARLPYLRAAIRDGGNVFSLTGGADRDGGPGAGVGGHSSAACDSLATLTGADGIGNGTDVAARRGRIISSTYF